jgi:hypothetical protein
MAIRARSCFSSVHDRRLRRFLGRIGEKTDEIP